MNPIFLAMAIMGMIVDDFSLMTYSDRSMIFKKVRGGGVIKKKINVLKPLKKIDV